MCGPEMKKMGKFEKYEVESALDSLKRAEKVKSDPALMKEVRKLAKLEKKAIDVALSSGSDDEDGPSSLKDLRKRINGKQKLQEA